MTQLGSADVVDDTAVLMKHSVILILNWWFNFHTMVHFRVIVDRVLVIVIVIIGVV
jgi:hypothetical protein